MIIVPDIGGLVGMKHTCGTTVARRKGRLEKEGKVSHQTKILKKKHYKKNYNHFCTLICLDAFVSDFQFGSYYAWSDLKSALFLACLHLLGKCHSIVYLGKIFCFLISVLEQVMCVS